MPCVRRHGVLIHRISDQDLQNYFCSNHLYLTTHAPIHLMSKSTGKRILHCKNQMICRKIATWQEIHKNRVQLKIISVRSYSRQ